MARRRRKGKGRRRSYRGKRRGGHKSKKIPMAATAGAALAGYNLFLKPQSSLSGQSVVGRIMAGGIKPTAKLDAIVTTTKPRLVNDVLIPVAGGIAISGVAKWVGANKYIHKIPKIGKKLDI